MVKLKPALAPDAGVITSIEAAAPWVNANESDSIVLASIAAELEPRLSAVKRNL